MRRLQRGRHRLTLPVHHLRLRPPHALCLPFPFHLPPFLHKMLLPVLLPAAGRPSSLLQRVREGHNGVPLPLQDLRVRPPPLLREAPHGARRRGNEALLVQKVSSSCLRCGRKGRSWSYRSKCKKYNLHVACVKEMLVDNWHEIYMGRGKGNRKLETNKIPISLKNTLPNHGSKSKGSKVKKGCEMAGLALQFVISAVLGDPTTLIAGVIGSLMSRG
ncbi:hypothetical protein FNV43_RR22729 [Rhamnella rubrinervis]|uniref:Uncharacterized protein n=1 Tax=Rhamnella rubrinervis TaxID=2594499 RepID=A0A8K0DUU7_9ROSA|nr:hypothetical protein FNV43_RR22729 [Rhamnella rubrinervis]